jgi:hypothetical protein
MEHYPGVFEPARSPCVPRARARARPGHAEGRADARTAQAAAFSYERYVVAVELWQAYGVRLQTAAGGEPVSALLPTLLLLNHRGGGGAHASRFSVPDPDGVLRVRSARGCAAGRQLFLSYGSELCNKDLLLHYGFTLPRNPADEVPLSFEQDDDDLGAACALRELRLRLLEQFDVGWDHSLRLGRRLPTRLLALLRLLTADEAELVALARATAGAQRPRQERQLSPRAAPSPPSPREGRLSVASERAALETLEGTLMALLEQLPDEAPDAEGPAAEAAAAAHCAAYIASQRDIMEAALSETQEMLAELPPEE